MERLSDKLVELFKIILYAFAGFGFAMFLAYLLVLGTSTREYIPMAAISQTLCYIGGAVIAITVALSDIFLEKISLKIRIPLFFVLLYIMGMVYFQFNAPYGVLSGARYFIGFSIWIVYASAIVLGTWLLYSYLVNNKYDRCLNDYKKKLNN